MNKKTATLIVAVAILSTRMVSAQSLYEVVLSGLGENPPNASTATGFGTVLLNAAQTQITVDESWSGLVGGPAAASHIHGPGATGMNAPVLFPFAGVPAATSGSIPEQTFAITPLQVTYLNSGLLYMNIHDAQFPGGEIRGQLQRVSVPDAGNSFTLLSLSLGAIAWCARRK